MQRHHGSKIAPALETLEARNLQSALVAGGEQALLPAVRPNPAIIVQGTPAIQPSLHAYHSAVGFFGQ